MTFVDKYKQFLDQIGWDEFNNVEKEYFFDDMNREPDGSGILFKILPSSRKKDYVLIVHPNTGSILELPQNKLVDFRKWVETNYTQGEDGVSFYRLQEVIDKERNRKIIYTYDLEQQVLASLQEFYSPRRIGRDVTFSGNKGAYTADFVIYGANGNIRVILEVKSSSYITDTTFHRLSEYVESLSSDIIFVLTDGEKAIYSHIGKPQNEGNFRNLLAELISIKESLTKTSSNTLKTFLRNAVSASQANTRTEKEKARKLKSFIDQLHSGDFSQDEKDHMTWTLSLSKERELFRILLGEYKGECIVKFSSARSLHTLLEKETIGMCSLVCMNDPSEKDYADTKVEAHKTLDNSADIFIISACSEKAETNLTMWRLYGDDTKGVCIKFWIDKEKLNKHGFYLAPVSYSKPNKEHFELDVVKNILMQPKDQDWKFDLSEWHVWKHFFKQNMYAIEEEIRLIYMPSEFVPLSESVWFTDDRTAVYSEMKVFDLSRSTAFPLILSRVLLGTNFPGRKENIPQFNRRFSKSNICIHKMEEKDLVSQCDIDNYR